MKKILSIFACFVVVGSISAQKIPFNKEACDPTINKEAQKLYKLAHKQDDDGFKRKYLKQATEVEPDYYEARFDLGVRYFKIKQFAWAKEQFEVVLKICPEYSSYTYYFLGMASYEVGDYQQAKTLLDKFLKFEDIGDKEYDKAKEILPELESLHAIYGEKVPFDPKFVKNISTPKDEYLGSLSPDNRYFYFIRKTEATPDKNSSFSRDVAYKEYFMQSVRQADGNFDGGKIMSRPFNVKYNNGAATITADNKTMYFVICEDNMSENCDIWFSTQNSGYWSDMQRLSNTVNVSGYWDSQPSVSYDGKTLVFVSNRPGGLGGTDIYICYKREDGSWTPPQNLGPTINTPDFEMSPFLHSDSQTLYFSSKGHKGAGGYDIFYTRKDSTGKWQKPINIGVPINTEFDEVSFFVSLDGKTGYYSSDRLKGPGGLDIYSFELHQKARPNQVYFVEGTVKTENGTPANSKLEIKNTRTKEIIKIDVDQEDGKYVAIVDAKDDYIMTIEKDGFAFTSTYIGKETMEAGKPIENEVIAEEIKVGQAYRINDIKFGTNSYELSKAAKLIIEEFAHFLKKNKTIKVAIYGHTDNVGNDNDNLTLSDNRAKAVMSYLMELGIDASRLSAKGFGASKPVASNATEAGKAKNRRTEFVITSK